MTAFFLHRLPGTARLALEVTVPGLLDPNDQNQFQQMQQRLAGIAGPWTILDQNAVPSTMNAFSGLPTAAGVASAASRGTPGSIAEGNQVVRDPNQQGATPGPGPGAAIAPPGAAPALGSPNDQVGGMAAMFGGQRPTPLMQATDAAQQQQNMVYGGGHPISARNQGILSAAGFPSFMDPRLIQGRLATMAQGGDAAAHDEFMRQIHGGGGGGGGLLGIGGGASEGETGAGGGGEHGTGGGEQASTGHEDETGW